MAIPPAKVFVEAYVASWIEIGFTVYARMITSVEAYVASWIEI